MEYRSEVVRIDRDEFVIDGKEYLVSTVLPIDRDYYETMAFGPGIDEMTEWNQLQHCSYEEEEAHATHRKVVRMVEYLAAHGHLPSE